MSESDPTARAAGPVFAFTDTNLLLEFHLFTDIDWRAVVDANDVVLVMAPVVLGETDRFKHHGTKRQKNRARRVSTAFDDLALSHRPTAVRERVQVMAIPHEPRKETFENERLQPDVPDDRLLASLIEFRARLAEGTVVLVTDDTGLRVKAHARGITVRKPDESLRLPEETDEATRKLEAAQRDLALLRNAQPHLRATINGESHGTFTIQLVNPLTEKKMAALLAGWRKRYPHIAATPDTLQGPAGLSVSLKAFEGLPGFGYVSKDQAAKYNRELDELFAAYEQYLEIWHGIVNQQRSTIKLALTLDNSGTLPADDVEVAFWTNAAGEWLDRPHKRLRPPAPAKPRDPMDFGYGALMPNLNLPIMNTDRDLDGPEIIAGDPQRVRYWVRRVKHHVPCALPDVYFSFAPTEDIGSFTLHYRINAANVREPVEGQIGINIETPDPVDPPIPPAKEPVDDDADDEDDGEEDI